MSSMNLKDAERKTLRLSNQDGLWDILLGLTFVSLALSAPLRDKVSHPLLSYIPMALFLLIGIPLYTYIKKRVVGPRTGLVKVSMRSNSQQRKMLVYIIGLQLVTLAVFLLAINGKIGDWMAGSPSWTVDAFFGFGVALMFALIAYGMDTFRFYIYGILLGMGMPLSVALSSDNIRYTHYPNLLVGGLMALVGVIVLILFIRRCPVVTQEE